MPATELSHAVAKYALEGDFRVQQDFGGRVVETTPSAAVRALASQVMALVPGDCTYARVDIVEADRGPLLMELELIEPELYFTIVAGSARANGSHHRREHDHTPALLFLVTRE